MPSRRTTLAAVLFGAPPLLMRAAARAQTGAGGGPPDAFPSRPVSVLSGYAPGGVTDITSRAVAERMARELGQPVVVENRVGGATAVANTAVAQARPDGHTPLLSRPSNR